MRAKPIKTSKKIPEKVIKRLKQTFDYLGKQEEIDPIELVDLIYKTTDFYYDHTISKDAVCKKGCSWCCLVPVDVSAVEAFYIQKKTGINPRFLNDKRDWHRLPDKTKCPFLKDNQCSIYEFRPFNCRVFATLDSSDYCVDGSVAHNVVNYTSNNALVMFRNILNEASEEGVKGQNQADNADVRSWFSDSYIQGEKIDAVFIDEA